VSLFRRARDEGPAEDTTSQGRWIVVGLGNPGRDYESTRHNAGAMALDELVSRASATLKRHKSGCLIAESTIGTSRVVFARPTWYKTPPRNLIVMHDEMDVPFGEIRIKQGGGTAGHNGLNSIVNHLGTKEFARVRMGVGRPRGRDAVDHVLAGFSSAQRKELPRLIEDAADATERIVEIGIERAMNEVNKRSTAG
jgi:PTH1 family peptidyl-tRNA hydrolase